MSSVSPTGSSTQQSGTTPQNPAGMLGKDDFLKLLVAQLKYQDPMSPSDSNQFMSQMAQFSTVEGINNLQSSLEQSQAVGLIGKQVAYTGADDTAATGVVSSIGIANGNVTLKVGDAYLSLSDITGVTEAPATGTPGA